MSSATGAEKRGLTFNTMLDKMRTKSRVSSKYNRIKRMVFKSKPKPLAQIKSSDYFTPLATDDYNEVMRMMSATTNGNEDDDEQQHPSSQNENKQQKCANVEREDEMEKTPLRTLSLNKIATGNALARTPQLTPITKESGNEEREGHLFCKNLPHKRQISMKKGLRPQLSSTICADTPGKINFEQQQIDEEDQQLPPVSKRKQAFEDIDNEDENGNYNDESVGENNNRSTMSIASKVYEEVNEDSTEPINGLSAMIEEAELIQSQRSRFITFNKSHINNNTTLKTTSLLSSTNSNKLSQSREKSSSTKSKIFLAETEQATVTTQKKVTAKRNKESKITTKDRKDGESFHETVHFNDDHQHQMSSTAYPDADEDAGTTNTNNRNNTKKTKRHTIITNAVATPVTKKKKSAHETNHIHDEEDQHQMTNTTYPGADEQDIVSSKNKKNTIKSKLKTKVSTTKKRFVNVNDDEDADVNDRCRRSKRTRMGTNEVGTYKWERAIGFDGREVMVHRLVSKQLVSNHYTRFVEHFTAAAAADKHNKKNKKKKKLKKTTINQVVPSDVAAFEEEKEEMNKTTTADNYFFSREALNTDKEFSEVQTGVSISAFSANDGILRLEARTEDKIGAESEAGSISNYHDDCVATYFVQRGMCRFEISGLVTEHGVADVIRVPMGQQYTIQSAATTTKKRKNKHKDDDAVCAIYFSFSKLV